MSDFLQFVDRVPTLPNRKKITHADSSVEYATIEYADEPVTTGTPLNKANFNRLNAVLGYNEVTGQWNPTTEIAEFTTELDLSNYKNNQRFLLQCKNSVSAPATDWETIIDDATTTHEFFFKAKLLKMSNGNVMMAGNYETGNIGSAIIINQNGEVIKDNISLGSGFNDLIMMEMTDGNILIVGGVSSSGSQLCFVILNQSGTIIKSRTAISSNSYLASNMIEMSNGNIMIVSKQYNSTTTYLSIIKKDGTIVYNSINAGSLGLARIIEMTNGNIMLIGNSTNSYKSGLYKIVDKNGNNIKSESTYSTFGGSSQITRLSNGKLLIVDYNNGLIRTIIDTDGNVESQLTTINKNFSDPHILKLSNNNIMIYSSRYVVVLDGETANDITTPTDVGATFGELQNAIQMSNGNIFIVYSNSTSSGYIALFDKNGSVVKQYVQLNSGKYCNPQVAEFDNGDVIISGFVWSTNPYGHYKLIKPISTSGTASLNGIELDTFLAKDSYYELVYNETQDKFICEEVRNAN